MTKIIVPTGYMGSGSSAVGDLLRDCLLYTSDAADDSTEV